MGFGPSQAVGVTLSVLKGGFFFVQILVQVSRNWHIHIIYIYIVYLYISICFKQKMVHENLPTKKRNWQHYVRSFRDIGRFQTKKRFFGKFPPPARQLIKCCGLLHPCVHKPDVRLGGCKGWKWEVFVVGAGNLFGKATYCSWLKSQTTTWDVWNPRKQWDKLPINWCRISASNGIKMVEKNRWRLLTKSTFSHNVGSSLWKLTWQAGKTTIWATKKKTLTFHHTGWLIGFLRMVYEIIPK